MSSQTDDERRPLLEVLPIPVNNSEILRRKSLVQNERKLSKNLLVPDEGEETETTPEGGWGWVVVMASVGRRPHN